MGSGWLWEKYPISFISSYIWKASEWELVTSIYPVLNVDDCMVLDRNLSGNGPIYGLIASGAVSATKRYWTSAWIFPVWASSIISLRYSAMKNENVPWKTAEAMICTTCNPSPICQTITTAATEISIDIVSSIKYASRMLGLLRRVPK
ncbi:hypothetical protein K493DRAFT_380553 [Basidiobolus meristosporus CBS 931.73]|uniref:Uncharacterized protein n=1 Tax=Basidiobolus meristosporus CBS 931.73 TaxID=1314790 RepID=A0A1Y1XXU7_9FUNG|nr:hypothetical protein K493DRAFT_380553 [Basidiobolus meristosporus CBS 931.73]|eukprot:ORX90572.1 hypothetical protein K493DRAFT_380553 [Basidiobolus meristosporus CBS 931.73]